MYMHVLSKIKKLSDMNNLFPPKCIFTGDKDEFKRERMRQEKQKRVGKRK